MLGLTLLLSYLAGSIPTSIIVGKILRGIDIRDYGSGNAGGTNTFRVLGWKAGLFVSAVDVFKGFAATSWLAQLSFGTSVLPEDALRIITGFAAVAGHIWTVFAGFRGGKGVGTAAGMLSALYPLALLVCLFIFLCVFLISRIVSLASISAAISLPVILSIFRYVVNRPVDDILYYFSFFAAVLIVFTHRTNIRRLISGTENSFKKKIL
ncbi:MAG TPA: glycerol-3-phosphate 1-O-acyltransferase PlsY [Calditrichaeota bacterium]|nr:glycerol-3-phosphate 1-O-acyltransferase PlsY [Calditrichota bacterium]